MKLSAQLSAACIKYGSPHVIVWRDGTDGPIIYDVDGKPDEITEFIHRANLDLVEKLTKGAENDASKFNFHLYDCLVDSFACLYDSCVYAYA